MKNNNELKNVVKPGVPKPVEPQEELQPVDYIRAVNFHLMRGNQKEAYDVMKKAAVFYPDDPFIVSYYGSLQAMVDKKFRSGIENCTRAIALYKKRTLSGNVERIAVLYLNLGRVYLAAENKKDAISAFKKGLQYDHAYPAIIKKLQKLGARERPVVSFLDRSNPVNKFLGIILHNENKTDPDSIQSPGRSCAV
jgi:tetratricopeptide (TPR) repeat protein